MFFTLKIVALFFCTIPLFQYFVDTSAEPISSKLIFNLVTILILLVSLIFIWMFMNHHRENSKIILIMEICIFFAICETAVYFSGFLKSDYKYLYIFIIVLYTIEFGMKTGLTIAFYASLILLGTDLLFFKHTGVNPYFENDLALCALFLVIAWAFGYYVNRANSHINMLSDYANIDGLTGVYNHRYFYEALRDACIKSTETGQPLSLIIIDIDYFKTYNDIFGHQQGDIVIAELSGVLKEFLLGTNIVISRYGGDEFTVILYNTNIDKASRIANDLRRYISKHKFTGEEHLPSGDFTVTMGVTQYEGKNDTYTNLVKRADSALYRAKYLRRNSVEKYASIFDELNDGLENNHILDEALHSLKTLIIVINSKDSYTFNHVNRVVMLCMSVAEHLKLSADEKRRLCYAAYLHDLGKINISKEILISDKKLSPEEWAELKRHSEESAAIISKFEGLEDIVSIVLQHHEKYDGTGYPNNIKGENIEYLARILTIADSFDAMTNFRPYQPTKTYEQAFEEIEKCSGTQFDPELAQIFIEAGRKKFSGNLYNQR